MTKLSLFVNCHSIPKTYRWVLRAIITLFLFIPIFFHCRTNSCLLLRSTLQLKEMIIVVSIVRDEDFVSFYFCICCRSHLEAIVVFGLRIERVEGRRYDDRLI